MNGVGPRDHICKFRWWRADIYETFSITKSVQFFFYILEKKEKECIARIDRSYEFLIGNLNKVKNPKAMLQEAFNEDYNSQLLDNSLTIEDESTHFVNDLYDVSN